MNEDYVSRNVDRLEISLSEKFVSTCIREKIQKDLKILAASEELDGWRKGMGLDFLFMPFSTTLISSSDYSSHTSKMNRNGGTESNATKKEITGLKVKGKKDNANVLSLYN